MINISVTGNDRLYARFRSMPPRLRLELRRKIGVLLVKLQGRVKRKLTGEVLNVVTGALRRSIQVEWPVDRGHIIEGAVYSAGDVKYGAIHEFGGVTRPHIIEPRNAEVLSFQMGGRMVFARYVNHPGSRMPQRSFMRSSLSEMREDVRRGMLDAVAASMRSGQ